MKLLKDYILIEELKDDMIQDGITLKYDDNNPYMFSRILEASDKAGDELFKYDGLNKLVLLTKRISKLPLYENYIISLEDVIGLYTIDEYNKLIKGE